MSRGMNSSRPVNENEKRDGRADDVEANPPPRLPVYPFAMKRRDVENFETRFAEDCAGEYCRTRAVKPHENGRQSPINNPCSNRLVSISLTALRVCREISSYAHADGRFPFGWWWRVRTLGLQRETLVRVVRSLRIFYSLVGD